MNRPVDPLCRWIRSEMRYESWEELLGALEREETLEGVRVVRQAKRVYQPRCPKVERMMHLAAPRKGRFAA